MNEQFVMSVIQTVLNSQNEISIDDYNMMVKYFNKDEEHEFLSILKKNKVRILEENEVSNKTKSQQNTERPLIDPNKIAMSNEQLCELYQKGEKKALDLLWMKNGGLIKKIVERYSNKYISILEGEDLEQSCFMEFKKAVEKFDSSKGFKFSTYAVWWLRQSVFRTIANTGTLVRIPVHKWDQVGIVQKYINKYSYCSMDEIINIINEKEGYDKSTIEDIIILAKNLLKPISLNYIVGEDNDTEYYEILVDESQKSVEESVIESNLKEEIEKCLGYLKEKERDIIKKRFGLYDGNVYTLEEIGREYGVTRERIRQIELKAIRKLRKYSVCKDKELKSFWEGN